MKDSPGKGSLLVIFLTVFIDLLGFAMVLPLLPIYAKHFTAEGSGWQLGALMASFSLMQFFFAPVWGRISDRVGRRPVLMIGLAGSVVFYTLFGVATTMKSLSLLFVSRIGAGIAGATIPTAQAYIADSTTLEKRPKGMALIGMAFGCGFTFGPLLGFLAVPGGADAEPGPWPGYAAAIFSAAALALAFRYLPESLSKSSEQAGRKVFDWAGLRKALSIPSVGMLLLAIFVCIFSFANFEVTLSLLIKDAQGAFQFSWKQVCLTYTFIGFMLALVQGGIVRRMAGRMSESAMASIGALLEVAGFALVVLSIRQASTGLLFVALAVVVAGFSFLQPSLNSLLSRRTDPSNQGVVLGIGQSVSALARICGPIGIPLFELQTTLPYWTAVGLMCLGLLCVLSASRSGKDFVTS